MLTFGKLPELDRQGRPKMFYRQRIHDKCYRRPHFDAGQFVEEWDDEGARKGYCLYKMGCKGPTTYNACSTVRWNDGVSFPIQSGHGCIGCSEDGFWDKGRFYDRLTNINAVRHRGQCRPGRRRRGRRRRRRRSPPMPASPRSSAGSADQGRSAEAPGLIPARPHTDTTPADRGKHRMSIQTPNGFTLDNSGKRVVVDPVTRIEGHLRVEVNVDENNVIRNAVSTGTMWRGIEVILKGRDPRDAWAFTERICGVCTGTHALTSVRAVEDALGIEIPENANSIRNIMQLTLQVHDHLVHFYHLHALDWVDVVSALKADPKATSALAQSISTWPLSSPGYFRDVQNRLKKFVESGQLGPFKNGYWGTPAYKLPPEANLMAVAHYLEALDFQKEIVKIHTIFGGKNPHPNWLVGGVPCAINVDGTGAVGAINMERLNLVSSIIDRVDRVHRTRSISRTSSAIASFYKDWLYGGGLSSKSVMSYGDIPEHANDYSAANLLLPRGGHHQRQSERGPRGRSARPRPDPGVRHPLLVQVPGRDQGPASLGRRHRAELRARPQRQGHQDQHRGDRRRRQILLDQGAALEGPCRWRSGRWPAGSSAMPRTSPSSRSRSTRC